MESEQIQLDEIIVARVVRRDADLFAIRDSIKRLGVLMPIYVVKQPGGGFKVVQGARRVVASRLVGLKTIPAFILTVDQAEEAVLLAPHHKVKTSKVEYSKALQRMLKEIPIELLAKKIKRPVSWVKARLKPDGD